MSHEALSGHTCKSSFLPAFTAGAVQQAIGALRGGKATVGLLKLDALSIAAAQLAPCIACIFVHVFAVS